MKLLFSVDQKKLSDSLALLQGVCSRRTPIEATSNVLFFIEDGTSEVVLRVTDLETSIQLSLPAIVAKREINRFLVNAKRLYDFIKDLQDQVILSFDGASLEINSGVDINNIDPDFKLILHTSDASLFPSFPESIENICSLDTSFLNFGLSKLVDLVPQSNPNAALNGLLFDFLLEGLSLVASDGHSLAIVSNDKIVLSEPAKWCLPKKAASELSKLIKHIAATSSEASEIFIGTCKGQIVFSGNGFNFFAKLLAEQFPAYRHAINFESLGRGQLVLDNLEPILRRVGYLLNGKMLPAAFSFKKNQIKVEFKNSDCGEISEQVSFVPTAAIDCSAKFFAPFLIGASRAFDDADNVDFYVKSGSPIYFHHDFGHCQMIYLVMPMIA